MSTNKYFIAALISINCCIGVSAQTITQQLDSFFNSLNDYEQINGSILIAQDGNVITKRYFGFADLQNNIKNSDSTEFTLASVSKVFTSTAILQLKDKGKFKLDDVFIKYFPDFPYPNITIRNLLSHTSGLPDYEIYEKQRKEHPDTIFTIKDVIPSLKMWKQPLNFESVTRWQYSNTNFCLLALLVEKVSGMPFQKYVQQNIFAPSKMYNTFFQKDINNSRSKNMAINYEHPFLYSSAYKNVDSL